jgi:catechol 2,3-dioxygenase-like lactoylglutathione lyase family enzyme
MLPGQSVNGMLMSQRIANVMLVVDDYDRAIGFYTSALGFEVLEDTPMGDGKRWVRVGPPGSMSAGLVLGKANSPEQRAATGRQAGGRVFLFLETDDFPGDLRRLESYGALIVQAPRSESYGMVAVFEDLYGNKWDLIGRNAGGHPS